MTDTGSGKDAKETGNPDRKARIKAAFSRSADDYEESAHIQRRVAAQTAVHALHGELARNPRVLEIGCGTGFLSRLLLDGIDGGTFLFTDFSEEMVAQCHAGIQDPRAAFEVMDGEAPGPDVLSERFDLIASSLTAQWFVDFEATARQLAELLAPEGRMVLSMLGEDSFTEWRDAHKSLGLTDGIPPFPSANELSDRLPGFGEAFVFEARIAERYDDARAFARSMKAVGAGLPRPGHKPLTPGQFKKLNAAMGSGFEVTYHILHAEFVRGGEAL